MVALLLSDHRWSPNIVHRATFFQTSRWFGGRSAGVLLFCLLASMHTGLAYWGQTWSHLDKCRIFPRDKLSKFFQRPLPFPLVFSNRTLQMDMLQPLNNMTWGFLIWWRWMVEAFMPSFTFPVDGHTVFKCALCLGAYYTFCIYFNFKIVLNKFIRLADKLKTLYCWHWRPLHQYLLLNLFIYIFFKLPMGS